MVRLISVRPMLVATLLVAILVAQGPQSAEAITDWWESASFYQIYPRSFQDSNNDGIGDLNGITDRLDYLKEIGITATWLSPIFKSPMVDFGYDCSDYTQIQDEYGTLDDFDRLVDKCRRLGIKLILDFVPNHTSDKHEWFIQSAARNPEYLDYYVWHPGYLLTNGTQIPPSNWVSVFRYSAWEWHAGRGEYYLHQFVKEQPDLNYREPKVVEAMKDVLRLWLTRGVSGFRIDAMPYLFEIEPSSEGVYPEEPLSGECDDYNSPCYLDHIYTQNRDETFDMAFQWRAVMDEFKEQFGGETKVLMIEAYTSLANEIRLYGTPEVPGPQIPFNFELISHSNAQSVAADYKMRIESWMDLMPAGQRANWVLGNHDNKRLATRFGVERGDLFNVLLQTLPGVAVTYNGEELLLTDYFLTWEQTIDPAGCNTSPETYTDFSRDPTRTPFPWDATANAGFSTNSNTWLPVNTNYRTINVAAQRSAPFSHLKVFQTLTSLRSNPTLTDGALLLKVVGNTLVYTRTLANHETFVVLLNFSDSRQTVDLTQQFTGLSSQLEVIVSSLQSTLLAGDLVPANAVVADAQVGTVLVTF